MHLFFGSVRARRRVLFAAFAIAATCASASAGAAEAKNLVFGISTQDAQNQYWVGLIDAFKKRANAAGVKVLVASPQTMDPAQQAQLVTNLVSQGVQCMAVTPADPTAMQSVFDQARAKGIFVVNGHFPVDMGHYDLFLDTGAYESGYMAGTEAAHLINQRFGGKANVALLTLPENATIVLRANGIKDALAKIAPDAKIVAEQRAPDQATAETVATNIMTAHPNVNVWAGVSDSDMLGVISAIKNRGRNPKDYAIVGIDAVPEFLSAIKAGEASATVNNPADRFGTLAFDACYGLVTDPNSPWHFITHAITKLDYVTPENVKDFLK